MNDLYFANIRRVVYCILNKNVADTKIMKLTGLTYREVLKILNDKKGFELAFRDNGQTYELIQKIRYNNSLKFLDETNENSINNLLGHHFHYLAKSDKDKIIFLISLALTYRLNLEALTLLTNENEQKLYLKIAAYTSDKPLLTSAIKYLFEYEDIDIQKNLMEAVLYLNNLEKAYRLQDVDLYKELLFFVGDTGIKELKEKRQNKEDELMTPSEYEMLLNYQMKYGLTTEYICHSFNVKRKNYNSFLNVHFDFHPEVKKHYKDMIAVVSYGTTRSI